MDKLDSMFFKSLLDQDKNDLFTFKYIVTKHVIFQAYLIIDDKVVFFFLFCKKNLQNDNF